MPAVSVRATTYETTSGSSPASRERPLESAVVVRRDEQRRRSAAVAESRGQLGEELVHGARLVLAVEQEVELVVQRPDALGDGDVLRHLRQLAPDLGWAAESGAPAAGPGSREPGRLVPVLTDRAAEAHTRSEHEHQTAARAIASAIGLVSVLARRGAAGRELERRVVAKDAREQILQRASRLDAELVDERAPRVVVALERLRLAAGAVERKHELAAKPLAERVLLDQGSSSATSSPWRPQSRSASIRSSSVLSRSSSSRRISPWANAS